MREKGAMLLEGGSKDSADDPEWEKSFEDTIRISNDEIRALYAEHAPGVEPKGLAPEEGEEIAGHVDGHVDGRAGEVGEVRREADVGGGGEEGVGKDMAGPKEAAGAASAGDSGQAGEGAVVS